MRKLQARRAREEEERAGLEQEEREQRRVEELARLRAEAEAASRVQAMARGRTGRRRAAAEKERLRLQAIAHREEAKRFGYETRPRGAMLLVAHSGYERWGTVVQGYYGVDPECPSKNGKPRYKRSSSRSRGARHMSAQTHGMQSTKTRPRPFVSAARPMARPSN